MLRRNAGRLAVAFAGVIALLAAGETAAFAAPANDDYSAATVIDTSTFVTATDTSGATSDPSDPTGCGSKGSVWYRFTPAKDGRIRTDITSQFDATFSVWTGSFDLVNCSEGYSIQRQFVAAAGTTYYFMIGECCGDEGSGGGSLRFSVTYSEAPPNDDFADAIPVDHLPYANTQDYRGATREVGEPWSCQAPGATAWYSYTPTTTGSVTARADPGGPGISVFTGTDLSRLFLVGCSTENSYRALTFVAQAGRTYRFAVVAGGYAEHKFQLGVAEQPTVDFAWPDDLTTINAATFSPSAFDPGDAGFSSYTWDFGDGATSTELYGMHLFRVDGDYTVKLTVKTGDGRTASVAKVVRVRTHDVAIVRVAAPLRARVGQSIKVDVDLRNTRYPEEVEVSLYRSPWVSEELVGSSTREVGVKPTRFSFRYTVTRADRAAGEITSGPRPRWLCTGMRSGRTTN